ncbi:metallophosphoesterase [Acerihabitans sp. TG2]|uniref:metallophosphoesterase n=1 Tax=Acerihabitans sp. TG2 TaxID=3096008 RepID=UPI002B234531|nr:metallophosphoesterase [Acerihabitans sp. TG2]MEA9391019.1 metallophosphoesterase [Acerihabitans sp. TG2]
MTSQKSVAVYRKIDPARWQRLFVVGDLHGCYDQLLEKLARQQFDKQRDLLISVGDLIDRGPENLQCLSLLDEPWFCAVRGNHEQMAIDALHSGDSGLWLANGGAWYLRMADSEQRRAQTLVTLCAQLPLVIDIPMADRHIVIAHADYPLDDYGFEQPISTEEVLWSRRRITRNQRGRGTPISGATHFFFGHTPLNRIRHYYNQFYIDTGAVFGGELSLIELTALPV